MDLLVESIIEIVVFGEIVNIDCVLNIVYGIDCNFLFGVVVFM